VIWLRHANFGLVVKPLSKPGRIVIAATAADDESNETEFPSAGYRDRQTPAALAVPVETGALVGPTLSAVVRSRHRFEGERRCPPSTLSSTTTATAKGSEDLLH